MMFPSFPTGSTIRADATLDDLLNWYHWAVAEADGEAFCGLPDAQGQCLPLIAAPEYDGRVAASEAGAGSPGSHRDEDSASCDMTGILRLMVCTVVVLVGLVPGPLAGLAATQPASASGASRHMLGYYVPYSASSWVSLEAHADALDIVAGQWVTVDACGGLASRDDQTLKQFAHNHELAVEPSLLTGSAALNDRLLTDEPTTGHLVDEIVTYVTAEGYDGFDLDLEGIPAGDREAYSSFVVQVATALHARGKLLSLAIPAKDRDATTGWSGAYDYAVLGESADLVTLMAYDYHGAWSAPGSVAPYDWVDRVLSFATSQIPAGKVLLGLAFYGYDWNTTSGGARAIGYAQASALAERYRAPMLLDPASQSVTFAYEAPAGEAPPPGPAPPFPNHPVTVRQPTACRGEGSIPAPTPTSRTETPLPDAMQEHTVWLEEAGAAATRLDLATHYGLGGAAAWRLGLEDSGAWPLLLWWRSGG